MIGLCFVLALLAHPVSRFQGFLNMTIWSILVLGFITLYAWPLLKDTLSIVLLVAIFIFHFAVMWRLYPLVPHHGYIAIGLIALSEIAISALTYRLARCQVPTRQYENQATENQGMMEWTPWCETFSKFRGQTGRALCGSRHTLRFECKFRLASIRNDLFSGSAL